MLIKKGSVSLYDYCMSNPDKAYLLDEWDYEKNKELGLDPKTVTFGSKKKVFWICKVCGYKWSTPVYSRTKGTGCIKCYDKRRSKTKLKGKIATTLYDYCQENPDKLYLLDEWDYDENKKQGITPEIVAFKSNKKVSWICSKDKRHKWEATIFSRVEGNGCPVCDGKKVIVGVNDLTTTHKELCKEWDYEKNYPEVPQNFVAGSMKRFWWKCQKCGNSWMTSINDRALGHTGCPECNKGISVQELAVYYYVKKLFPDTVNCYKNLGYELDLYIPELNLAIELDGGLWHENRLESDNKKDLNCKRDNIRLIRIREKELKPTVSAETIWINGSRDSCVEQGIKDLFEYMNWSYDFDINFSNDYSNFIDIKKIREIENSLAVKFPEIAAQWHPTKNGTIKPTNVSAFSSRKFWWQCPTCGYEWSAVISGRTKGNNCPSCSGRLPWSNEEIQIMLEHYEKEGLSGTLPLLPNRNKGTIIAKASELNLRSRIGEWTDGEIQIMLDYYESEGLKIMNRLPNKSKNSILHKAQRLGLKSNARKK